MRRVSIVLQRVGKLSRAFALAGFQDSCHCGGRAHVAGIHVTDDSGRWHQSVWWTGFLAATLTREYAVR